MDRRTFQSLFGLPALVMIALLFTEAEGRAKRRLDSFIEHYETLDYDPKAVESEHNRVRRETLYFGHFHGEPLLLHFRAHGRSFHLHLLPDHQVVKPTTTFTSGGKPFPFDSSELFVGQLADEDDTVVSGAVVSGVFRGVIQTPQERYHIEPARRFFHDQQKFHSVIYRASDVSFNHTTCGVSKKIQKWMESVQSSAVKPTILKESMNRYTKSANRQRRATNLLHVECQIRIAADHKFTKQISQEEGIDPAQDPVNAQAAAARALAVYVSAVNRIYRTTVFGNTGENPEDVQFAIKNVEVYLTVEETKKVNKGLGEELLGVDRFLELWSQTNHSAFCLAYLFTYRDFDNGVLGLAWVGSSGSASGGVCDKYVRYSDGTYKTLNTGIVTLINYNKRVAAEVSHLTFAHELGHNLGSNHDPSGECSPGGDSGNYIMYAHATSGTKSNNRQFSKCSRNAIGQVLSTKALVDKADGSCFDRVSNGQICGNGVREDPEQCDCGLESECAKDNCCTNNCTLKVGVQCSPQQGPCCDSSCTFLTAAQRPICSEKSECRIGTGSCPGTSATCTLAQEKKNGTLCSDNTATCYKGACTGSLCSHFEQEPCFCSSDDSCQVCCKKNANATCIPLRNILRNDSGINNTFLAAGSPCDNYLGFCDFLNFCRRLDDQGPIARLKDTLFSSKSISNAYEWSKENWYIVLVGVIGLVGIMTLVVVFCSKHTEKTVDTIRRKKTQGNGGKDSRSKDNVRARRPKGIDDNIPLNNRR